MGRRRNVEAWYYEQGASACPINSSSDFSGTIRMAQVSIITTCFNQADVIARCLESVSSQSVPPLECIVVDDGSTMGDVQDTVVRIGNPIMRVVKQANSGVSGARNRGLSEAVGEFVLFVDGDDWLLPTALEHLGSLADSNPEAGLFFGRSQRVSQSTGEPVGESSAVAGDFYSRMLVSCFAQHPAQVLIRREVLSREKFRSFVYPAEDFDLYLRLLNKLPAASTEELVSCYSIHQSNISADPFLMLRAMMKIYNLHRRILPNDETLHRCFLKGRSSQRNLYMGRCFRAVFQWLKGNSSRRPKVSELALIAIHAPVALLGEVWRRLLQSDHTSH